MNTRMVLLASKSGKKREGTFNGKAQIIVPVTALVEQVLRPSNAAGPELALATEFGKYPDGWNGRPVVIDHPEVNGRKVAANSPHILETYQVGFIFNTTMEGKDPLKPTELRTEAWIDPERCEELGGEAQKMLDRINAGETIEVSTGLFTQLDETPGRYNGENYDGKWSEVVPDHLAFLTGKQIGACSIADGCGAQRTNSGKEKELDAAFAELIKTFGADEVKRAMAGRANADCACVDKSNCSCVHTVRLNSKVSKRDDVHEADRDAAVKKYGDVDYADETNKKYPIDTPEHIRAAWDYINKGDDASKYSTGEVDIIKSRIVTAWKRKIDKAGPPEAEADDKKSNSRAKKILDAVRALFKANSEDISDADTRTALSAALATESAGGDSFWNWQYVVAVFDSNFVYFDAEEGLVKRPYVINSDLTVSLGDTRTPVNPVTKYVETKPPLAANSEGPMKNKKELIDSLVASANSAFGEPDRAFLETLDEERLTAFHFHNLDGKTVAVGADGKPVTANADGGEAGGTITPAAPEKQSAIQDDASAETGVARLIKGAMKPKPVSAITSTPTMSAAADSTSDDPDEEDEKAADKKKKAKTMSAEEYVDAAPIEVREVLGEALKRNAAYKGRMMEALRASNRCDYTDDELKSMTTRELERLTKLSAIPPATFIRGVAPTAEQLKENAAKEGPNGTGVPMPMRVLGEKKPMSVRSGVMKDENNRLVSR